MRAGHLHACGKGVCGNLTCPSWSTREAPDSAQCHRSLLCVASNSQGPCPSQGGSRELTLACSHQSPFLTGDLLVMAVYVSQPSNTNVQASTRAPAKSRYRGTGFGRGLSDARFDMSATEEACSGARLCYIPKTGLCGSCEN